MTLVGSLSKKIKKKKKRKKRSSFLNAIIIQVVQFKYIVVCTHHEAVYPDLMNLIAIRFISNTHALVIIQHMINIHHPIRISNSLKGIQLISTSPISLSADYLISLINFIMCILIFVSYYT